GGRGVENDVPDFERTVTHGYRHAVRRFGRSPVAYPERLARDDLLRGEGGLAFERAFIGRLPGRHPLLRYVSQFVCQQREPRRARRLVASRGEDDVVAQRISGRPQRLGRRAGVRVGVDAHAAEVRPETCFKGAAGGGIERLSTLLRVARRARRWAKPAAVDRA